jgi:hypothetical protein
MIVPGGTQGVSTEEAALLCRKTFLPNTPFVGAVVSASPKLGLPSIVLSLK